MYRRTALIDGPPGGRRRLGPYVDAVRLVRAGTSRWLAPIDLHAVSKQLTGGVRGTSGR